MPRERVPARQKEDLPVGYKIVFMLTDKGVTQSELAKKLGVSSTFLGYVIWGQSRSKRVMKGIANELGFDTWKELVNHKEVL